MAKQNLDGTQHATRSSSPAAPGSRGQRFARGGEPRGHWQRGPKWASLLPVLLLLVPVLVVVLVSRLALRPPPLSLGQLHRGPASAPAASLGHAHLGPGGDAAAEMLLPDDARSSIPAAGEPGSSTAAAEGAAKRSRGRRRGAVSSLREARRPRPPARVCCAAGIFF